MTTTIAPRQQVSATPTVQFGRLARAEFRKFFDTRAGLWLTISIAAVTLGAAIVLLATFTQLPDWLLERGWLGGISPFLMLGVSILLPPMAILLVTTEWSQRTMLNTFALEPRRLRVIAAKAVVLTAVTLASLVLAVGLSATTYALGMTRTGMAANWTVSWGAIGGNVLALALSMAMAFGFALALMNTPAAIVLYMALPVAFQTLSMVPGMAKVLPWINLADAQSPLVGGTMGGDDWAKLAVSSLIWVVAPIAVGIWRHLRTEAK